MDPALIARSLAGNEEAFAALFHQHKNLVYKTAFLMLEDPAEAEDVLQEVFLQVHKSLSSYQPSRGAFTTWLHRITVNHCLNRRRKRRLPTLPLTEISSNSLIEPASSPESQIENEQAIQQALSRLSEKLRIIVILRYYWELSHVEMAQILDLPIGTVESRLDLALKTLRKELGRSIEEATSPTAIPQREAEP